MYAFDPSHTGNVDGQTVALEWVNYKKNPTNIYFQAENELAGLLYGEGYLYASANARTVEFEGTAGKSNNYTETKDYTYDETLTNTFNGWRLVGNFFTCNAYINYIDAQGNALNADFYTMNTNGNGYVLSSSSVALPPLTGAFINHSATGKIQYSTEPVSSKGRMLNMTVAQGRGTVDQARIRFGEGYNLQHMSFRDGAKLYIPQEGKDYAVVRSEGNGEIPVNFKAEKNGTYTLSFNAEEVEFSYLHLIDNMTGNDVDLIATPSYSFEAKTTDYASRFRLVFSTGNASEDSFAFFSNGSWFINNDGKAILQVVDVMGRIISSETINGNANVSLNAANGVYVIRLINGNDVKTQKIVVR